MGLSGDEKICPDCIGVVPNIAKNLVKLVKSSGKLLKVQSNSLIYSHMFDWGFGQKRGNLGFVCGSCRGRKVEIVNKNIITGHNTRKSKWIVNLTRELAENTVLMVGCALVGSIPWRR